jgi:hypothetical protein
MEFWPEDLPEYLGADDLLDDLIRLPITCRALSGS